MPLIENGLLPIQSLFFRVTFETVNLRLPRHLIDQFII